MKCIQKRVVGVTSDTTPKDITEAFILADTVPSPLPTTGADVGGMTANEVFAPFSMIYVISNGAVYVANESGVFTLLS